MKRFYFFPGFFWIMFMAIVLNPQTYVFTQWSNNPNINTPICAASSTQTTPVAVSDGFGGVIIAWADFRNGSDYEIYAQRLDSNGVSKWTMNGVAVCTTAADQIMPAIVSNDSGGAIIAWADKRRGIGSDIYAQMIDVNGINHWTTNGVQIYRAGAIVENQSQIAITKDNSGGAIVTCKQDSGTRIQRVSKNGLLLWATNGVSINRSYAALSVVADGKGGILACYGNGSSLSITRISYKGDSLWNTPIATSNAQLVSAISDQKGGVLCSWRSNYVYGFDVIYTQSVDSLGSLRWATGGVPILSNSTQTYGTSSPPRIISSSPGEAIVAWFDNRRGFAFYNYSDVYAQRVATTGTVQWKQNGAVISNASNNLIEYYTIFANLSIVSDLSHGAVICWEDNRRADRDIYTQRINTNGTPQWTPNGEPVSTAIGNQNDPKIIFDNQGRSIIIWEDARHGKSNHDIYAQRVGTNGFQTRGESHIASIQDIPNDQGGKIRIKWSGSRDDVSSAGTPITQYGLWRKIPQGMSVFGKRALSPFMVDDSIALNYDFITSVPAMQSSQYNVVSATLLDSNGTGTNWTKFIVTAHTSTPSVYYVSDVDSGYSIDNFPLPPPTNLIVNILGNTARLSWRGIPPDTNLAYYSIYRLEVSSNCDSSCVRVATTYDTTITDNSFDSTSTLTYYVCAVKRNGNESASNKVHLGIAPKFFSYSVSNRWNMVSVPLLISNYDKTAIYPTAISNAFAYEGSYTTKSTLANGIGYWLKFNSNHTICMHGAMITLDTIDVVDGWNLIGSISEPISVSSITSNPPHITTSDFFGYSGGYSITDTIQPGKGYWVKVNQAGSLILSSNSDIARRSTSHIRIVSTSELPPAPPEPSAIDVSIDLPKIFTLENNYPNPFNPTTTIKYALPVETRVTISIYNLLGQEINRLIDVTQVAGYHSVQWSAEKTPSGVYFYRLQAGTFSETKKLVLIK